MRPPRRLATRGDQLQYDEGEGPCLDAAMHERWLYTPDVATDRRWPRSCARMHRELGVGSMFSCRLTLDSAPRQTLGGINLYATTSDAFDHDDRMLAILLSSMAAVVVDASRRQAQLRAALESRQVIGEAIGMPLRYQSNLSSDEAFEVLTRASQRMNVKLREVTPPDRAGRTRLLLRPRYADCRAGGVPRGARGASGAQRRQQLTLGPPDELLLTAADLHERDLGEAGLDERADLVDVLLHVRTAGQAPPPGPGSQLGSGLEGAQGRAGPR